MSEQQTSKTHAEQLLEEYDACWIEDERLCNREHGPTRQAAKAMRQRFDKARAAVLAAMRTADEPSSVAVNEPVFYRCETCKEIMLAAHLVGTDSHERIEETSEGQPYQVTCGPVRPSVLSAGEYINRFLPANWMNDSSLETWFPITAEELKRLKDERAAQPPPAVDVAPIAKLTVRDGLVQRAGLYAPGLPDGDHDVFPVPLSPKGELRPHVLAEPPSVDWFQRTVDAECALVDARRYVEAYEPKSVSEAHDRDLMLGTISAITTVTKSACTCPPGLCCERSGAAKSDQRICRDAGETKGGQS